MTAGLTESFIRLTPERQTDESGAVSVIWQEAGELAAGAVRKACEAATSAARPAALERWTLYHDRAVTLHCGDRLKRARDGLLLTALTDSLPAPEASGLALARTICEGTVTE